MTDLADAKSATIKAGPHELFYTELGRGKPLICIHGGGPGASGISNYNRNLEALAKRRRVILLDLPGYGRSEMVKPKGPRLLFFSGTLRNFMDALDIEQADIIGNSLGGGAAVKLALDTPERAHRLVLMGPAVGFPVFSPFPTEGWKHMAGYYAPPGPTLEKMRGLVEIMVNDSSTITDELIEERFEDSARPEVIACQPGPPRPESPFEELWKELGTLRHETLLIWGRDDRVVPFDMSFIVFKQLRNVQMHAFGDCGHWTQWERAQDFNRIVDGFLADRKG